MKKIVIILFFIIINLKSKSFDSSEYHCFCGSTHKNYFLYSPEFNYNFGNNWSNGLNFIYIPKEFSKFVYHFDINSTRIGSSLFTDKLNQDFITVGISRDYFIYSDSFLRYLTPVINIGYLNTENIKVLSIKNNFIIAPEIVYQRGRLKLAFGWNVLNKYNINNNLAPFYITLGITKSMYFYCENRKKGYWFNY